MVLNVEPGKRTVIHLAAKYGQAQILDWLAQYLNQNGVDVNHKDDQGNTAIHLAAKYNHISSIKVIIDNYLLKRGHLRLILFPQVLVLNSASVEIRNKLQLKPIDIAEINGFNECKNYLAALESSILLAEETISLKTELLQ